MKITVDTNILISATFWYGDSFRILERVENKEIELVLSNEIIKEYEEVLAYLRKNTRKESYDETNRSKNTNNDNSCSSF